MGSWGITMRESDYGLNLLSIAVGEQLILGAVHIRKDMI